MKNDKNSQKITQNQLVRIFKDIKEQNSKENRFCFLIGAGASKSSGIDTGWELSKKWYDDIKEVFNEEELKKWEKEIEFDEKRIGEFYTQIYKKRFEASFQVAYDELKKIMEDVEPSLGYIVLSQILTNEKHNFVITTNFDYLIEDAVKMYTSSRPFTAGHETLAEFVSTQTERPTIIKVHRDLFLQPFNDKTETQELKEEWGKILEPILKNFNLLVIGYGGNDGSLMNYLKNIDVKCRKPIYWCVRNNENINSKTKELLSEKDYIVNISGFDELMYSLYGALAYNFFDNLDKPDNHFFVEKAKERISNLNTKMNELMEKSKSNNNISEETKEILKGVNQLRLQAYLEKDIDKKEKIYQKGLKDYPKNADLLDDYAIFLENIRQDYDKAEDYYKQAMELDPKNADIIGNYATLLFNIRQDYNKAENYYKKSIELDPKNANKLWNYAVFLAKIRQDYDKAENYCKQAMELDPKNANKLGNYAHFLIVYKQDFEKAKNYIDKSFELVEKQNLALLTELWFYRYAHYHEWQKQGEKELNMLISKGAKSIGWNLQAHVDIAKQHNFPDIKKLEKFAKLITE